MYIMIITIGEHVKKFHVYNNFISFSFEIFIIQNYKLDVNYNYSNNFNEYYKW